MKGMDHVGITFEGVRTCRLGHVAEGLEADENIYEFSAHGYSLTEEIIVVGVGPCN